MDRHPNLTSVVSVILWFLTLAFLSVMTGCRSQHHIVEIVKTDTLHVYHTDTVKVVHNDTIFSSSTTVQHDSVMLKEKETYYINAATGEVIRSEKEREKESYHNNEKDSQSVRHTVDSLVKVFVDSVYQARYNEKPVIIEVEEPVPWYKKAWNWMWKFALTWLIALVLVYFIPCLLKWIDKMRK